MSSIPDLIRISFNQRAAVHVETSLKFSNEITSLQNLRFSVGIFRYSLRVCKTQHLLSEMR